MTVLWLRASAVVATALVFLACNDDPTAPQTIEVTPTPGLEGFPARLDALRVQLRIPGMAAAIAQDGEIVWARGFGQGTVESGQAATSATPFHLASLTKPFGATILMKLVEEGLVGLDDPVSDHGVIISGTGTILVRHLLTHTSEGVPGSHYQYSGNRFANLDQVILSASGRSFADLLVERILGPLGLSDTAIVRAPERKLTFVVPPNTQTLSSPYGLGGDNNVMRSDVVRMFVEDFVLGEDPLLRGG